MCYFVAIVWFGLVFKARNMLREAEIERGWALEFRDLISKPGITW